MAELRYVDWDGLVYYDGKIKSYIADKAEDFIKMGGIVSFENLPDPSWQNLNYIYKINEEFTSNNRFEKPGYVYKAGTWVQVVDFSETYKYAIFNEEVIGNTSNVDLSNYYTKSEVDKKIEEAISPEPDLSDYYTKSEVDDIVSDSRVEVENELSVLTDAVAAVQESLEEKADKTALESLASKEFVISKIAEAELNNKDVDLSNYYTKTEVENIVKTSIDDIDIPDISNLATKQELQDAINSIEHPTVDLTDYYTKEETSALIDEAISGIDIPQVDLTGYATEKFVLDKVAEINVPTKVSELENDTGFITADNIPDTSIFVTNETFETVQEQVTNIQNTYVTTETVTEVVETQVDEVVTTEIENKVIEVIQEKVTNGEISVNTDAIEYDTW